MAVQTLDELRYTASPSKLKSNKKYELEQTFKAIPGTIVRVLLEFPNYSNGKSAVIELDDVMTLSYSLFRVKVPVVTLGQSSVGGYGIGVRTVAGTMIRSVFMTDKLSEFQTECYLMDQTEIRERLIDSDNSMPTGVPMKDKLAFMKDDLAYFNIHILSIAEELKNYNNNAPYMRQEMIIGAMIINNGQTYSVEDLITETSFSFQAKAIRTASDPTDYSRGFSNGGEIESISSLLRG